MLEKFSDDQVKHFYTTFPDNLKHYEGVNKDTVDTLFAFTDFDAFKKKMLIYKRGMDDGSLAKNATEDNTGVSPIGALVSEHGADAEAVKKIYYDLAAESMDDKALKWKKTLTMPE